MAVSITLLLSGLVAAAVTQLAWTFLTNVFRHPLAQFPGPLLASTGWYKTWQEVFRGRNWIDVLRELHAQYGEVVRVGPNELQFSDPEAYPDIYNASNRWSKEATLYQSFGEDQSSFGFLHYREAKQRRDVLAPLFSRRAILDLQGVVRGIMDRLCVHLAKENAEGKSSDMLFALRCFTLDTIVTYCFAQDIHATEAKDFQAPVVVAMDASLPTFVVFKHFSAVRKLVFSFPGWLTKMTAPGLGGLVDLQQLLGAQVKEVASNPELLKQTSHPTIYHRLLDPEANEAAGVPSQQSLYEETQALLFGGADSVGNTVTIGLYHVLQSPKMISRLKAELLRVWPDLQSQPRVEVFEKLPFLAAVIKESLRLAPGVTAPLPRVVPSSGATISGRHIPPGAIVGVAQVMVHSNPDIFVSPEKFDPERWLGGEASSLERWLVPFSRGPRACLGQTLAMCELQVAFAGLFRRFDIQLDEASTDSLAWRECFLPHFNANHMRAFCKPVVS
ncbi:unnamed protein product [Zymoseptoria tritici ST99CH_3D1]|nr:unnamed protein product [Zymoseptoria tritici ST99CH_3D1]